MNNKEYGVKLNVDISKFQENLNKAKELAEKSKKDIETAVRKVKIDKDDETGKRMKQEIKIGVDTSEVKKQLKETADEFEKRMANVKPKIYNYNSGNERVIPELDPDNSSNPNIRTSEDEKTFWKMFSNMKGPVEDINIDLNDIKENIDEIPPKVEKTTNEMKDLGNETEKTKGKGQGISIVFARFGDDISKSINKGISSIKRFGLSLIGIRGAYTLLTRASNAYMAQDQDMHTRLQANWIALGAMLAPIIEKLIALFQRLVAYINIFVKAFTGGKVDLLSKAMKVVEKNTKKTTKAVKSLNKELATIDEITNLNFDQGSSGGGFDDGGGFDISDALNEIANLQLNPKIVEIMEWLGTKLRDAWDWCVKLKDKFNEWGISLEDVLKLVGVIFGAKEVGRIVSAIAEIIGVSGGTAGIYGMVTALALVDVYLGVKLYNKITELGKLWRQQQKAEERLGDSRIQTMYTVEEQIKKIDEQLKNGQTTDEYGNDLQKKKASLIQEAQDEYVRFNKEAKDGVDYSKAQVSEMENMRKKLEKITKTDWKSTVDVEINAYQSQKSKNWWDNFMESVRQAYTKKWENPGRGGSGTGFASGNVAYEPTYAQFGEYAGARSNPEITAPQNMMRETLFEALTDALPMVNSRNGDTILYVNGKELARATYQDFKNEGNRLGSSSVAIRRG